MTSLLNWHSIRYAIVSHCGLYYVPSVTNDVEVPFNVLIFYSYIFFVDLTIQIIFPVLLSYLTSHF